MDVYGLALPLPVEILNVECRVYDLNSIIYDVISIVYAVSPNNKHTRA